MNEVSKYKIGDKVIYDGDRFQIVSNIKKNNRVGDRSADFISKRQFGNVIHITEEGLIVIHTHNRGFPLGIEITENNSDWDIYTEDEQKENLIKRIESDIEEGHSERQSLKWKIERWENQLSELRIAV